MKYIKLLITITLLSTPFVNARTINNNSKIAYVINSDSSIKGSLFKCTINSENMTLNDTNGYSTCVSLDSSTAGSDTNGNSSWLYAHSITISNNYLFVLSENSNGTTWVQSCPINPTNGIISKCSKAYQAKSYKANVIKAITTGDGEYLYVGNGNSELRKLKVDINTGKLTDQGIVYTGKDNGNYIQAIGYSRLSQKLIFSRGPDSSHNYYLHSADVNIDGTLSSVTSSKLKPQKYSKDGITFGDIMTIPSSILLYRNTSYISIINVFINFAQEENAGSQIYGYDLSTSPTTKFIYKDTGDSLSENMTIIHSNYNSEDYAYINYSNNNLVVCNISQDLTKSGYPSTKNCINSGFGKSKDMVIYTLGNP